MRYDVTRGECGMAAKLDLDGRCEPAQEVAFALRDEERGLGEIVLRGNRLHRRLRQPFGEWAHRRRIAAEQSAGEGIDLIERNAHNEPRGLSTIAHPAGCRGIKQMEESMKAEMMVPGADGGRWEVRDVQRPIVTAGHVLVRVRASSLNRAEFRRLHTLRIRAGQTPEARTGGGDAAGEVVEIGRDVSGIKPGDRVMGRCGGGFAEFALLDAREVMP